jgi:hypothetical protein
MVIELSQFNVGIAFKLLNFAQGLTSTINVINFAIPSFI